jgi:hypothetical protein
LDVGGMQLPEENFFNVVEDEYEARGAGGMTTIMLIVSAVFTALAAVICFMAW